MATIPTPGSVVRHVRKAVTFDGGAGSGAVGTVDLFTITGRVLVMNQSVFTVTALEEAGVDAQINYGTASATFSFGGQTTVPTSFTAGAFWVSASGSPRFGIAETAFSQDNDYPVALSESLILTITGHGITAGVMVFDIWYTPITDDGALAGDDLDTDYNDYIEARVAAALATYDPPTKAELDSGLTAALSSDTLTEAYAASGAEATVAQLLYAIYSAVAQFSISGTTLATKKLDGATTALTFTLDDASDPTSRVRSA